MLQIQGMPSRQALIDAIIQRNLHIVPERAEVTTLFEMLQKEESPFTISKEGPAALKALISALPALSKYEPFIKKTLAVRIL